MDYISLGPKDPARPWSGSRCCDRGFDFATDAARKSHVTRYHPEAVRFEVCDTSTDTHGPERVYVRAGSRWVLA